MSTEQSYDQTHRVLVKRRGPLPTFHYHEHFMEMLDFVASHYAHALPDRHIDLVRRLRSLPRPQVLQSRSAMRKPWHSAAGAPPRARRAEAAAELLLLINEKRAAAC